MADAEHLVPQTRNRRFRRMPPLPDAYGADDAIRVYESSAAESPHLWLAVKQTWKRDPVSSPMFAAPDGGTKWGPAYTVEAHAHLTAETATKLRDQLDWLLANHYQGNARPEAQEANGG